MKNKENLICIPLEEFYENRGTRGKVVTHFEDISDDEWEEKLRLAGRSGDNIQIILK